MVEMVHDRIAAGETTVVSTTAVLRCRKRKWKSYHITTFPGQSLSKNRETQFGIGYGPVAKQILELELRTQMRNL
jgi:hypothetical protein